MPNNDNEDPTTTGDTVDLAVASSGGVAVSGDLISSLPMVGPLIGPLLDGLTGGLL